MPYYGSNIYINKLNTKYSGPISTLSPFQQACIYDIIELSYKAGVENERRRNQRVKVKKSQNC